MSNVSAIKERLNEIQGAILAWLQEQADFPVIIADQSDPRPDETHLSFKLLTSLIKLGGMDETIMDTATGIMTLRGFREFTVAIEAVGNPVGPDEDLDDMIRATDILNAVQLSIDLPSTRAYFDSFNVAIAEQGSVTDISQLLETEKEPRALLEVVFRARFDISDTPGYFDKVAMSGDFDADCDGTDDISTGIIQVS